MGGGIEKKRTSMIGRDNMAEVEQHNREDNCFWDTDYKPVHPKTQRGYCKLCPKCVGCAEEMKDE